jgi:hypothetical protein
MQKNYLRIQPIEIPYFGGSKTANAIFWSCSNLERASNSARLFCELVYVDDNNPSDFTPTVYGFSMEVPDNILQTWLDDSIIDDFVLTYSPEFIKA